MVRGRCGHRFQPRGRGGTQHHHRTKAFSRPGRGLGALGYEILHRSDGRQEDGEPQTVPEQLARKVNILDIVQDPRSEGNRVEGPTVALHGRLRVRTTDQIERRVRILNRGFPFGSNRDSL